MLKDRREKSWSLQCDIEKINHNNNLLRCKFFSTVDKKYVEILWLEVRETEAVVAVGETNIKFLC